MAMHVTRSSTQYATTQAVRVLPAPMASSAMVLLPLHAFWASPEQVATPVALSVQLEATAQPPMLSRNVMMDFRQERDRLLATSVHRALNAQQQAINQ
jgi:hypothetical protein